MIAITFENLSEVQAWLAGLPDMLQAVLLEKSGAIADALQQKAVGKLSGEVLESRSGTLRDSIATAVQETANGVNASVFVEGDVPYAAIQEYGGTTKAHIIEEANAKVLAFTMNGKQAFFAHVNHPGSVIPEHSYLRSSLDEMGGDIADAFSEALNSQL